MESTTRSANTISITSAKGSHLQQWLQTVSHSTPWSVWSSLQFLWNLASHYAQLTCGFNLETAVNTSDEPAMDYSKLQGLKYHEKHLRLLTYLYEGVTTRVLGATFDLTC